MSDGKPILLRFEMRLQDLRRIPKTGSQQTYQEAKQRKQDRPTLGGNRSSGHRRPSRRMTGHL